MASELYCELSKTCSASLMRRHNQKSYSPIEFNDLAVQTRPRFLFEAVGRLVEQLIHLYITTMECKVITVMSL